MINKKNITVHSVAEFTTLIDNLIEIQIEAERLGIAEATAKVSGRLRRIKMAPDEGAGGIVLEFASLRGYSPCCSLSSSSSSNEYHSMVFKILHWQDRQG